MYVFGIFLIDHMLPFSHTNTSFILTILKAVLGDDDIFLASTPAAKRSKSMSYDKEDGDHNTFHPIANFVPFTTFWRLE